MYDILVRGEERVSLYFFKGMGHGFLAEWTSDLFEGEELGGVLVLNEIDI